MGKSLGMFNSRKFVIISIIIIIFLSSSLTQSTNNLAENADSFISKPIMFQTDKNFPSSNDLSLNVYNPITNVSGAGSSFTARDRVTVNHEFSLNLTYDDGEDKFISDFNIDPLIGLSVEELKYGITEIRAKKDNYTIENLFDDYQILSDPVVSIAQGFEVSWSNATFYGALLNLDAIGGASHTGNNFVELFLVKENETSGLPDISVHVSDELNGPYWRSNPLPAYGSTVFYDFEDVQLSKGFYYIILNLTNYEPTSSKKFAWRGHLESSGSGGDTYYYYNTDTWSSLQDIDHTMTVQLLPSYENGSAIVFSDLNEITLEDNSLALNSFTDTISSVGSHHITSDTSIEIDFVNEYTFYVENIASSNYQAFNSTYDSFSIEWNFTWNIGIVDYSPYTNLNRTQILYVPKDWDDTPEASYNSTLISFYDKINDGYLLYLGNNTESGTISLNTTSPNYIQNLVLSDDFGPTSQFHLGYWTNDQLNAYGFEGDTIYSSVSIKNSEDTGIANFTLFDPEGNIIPTKLSLPANLTYIDTTSYSISEITSSGSGLFDSEITLDPSVYGSDSAGYWTFYVFWENNSEIGIFSKKISIQSSIIFNASWETLPYNDIWTNDDSQIILRMNGDSLKVKASYFSNSEPFFTEFGIPIENATIGYLTSWNLEDYLDEFPSQFSGEIPILTTAGLRFVTLLVNDTYSIQDMVTIPIQVFNQYSISPINQNIETNTSEEVPLEFRVINETDPMKGSFIPDSVTLKINNNPVSSEFYSVSNNGEIIQVTVNLKEYGISSGFANITLDITKENFRASYIKDVISVSFSVNVTSNNQLPLYVIIIIIAAIFVIITITAVMFTIISHRKTPKEVVELKDKSKVVGLLDSVLAMKKILILHTETSLPIFELDIGQESSVESTLVSGFLAALVQMGKTISGTETGEIRKLEYKNFVVNSANSDTYTVFLFSTEDIIKEVQVKLFDLIMWFEYSFPIQDGIWDGKVDMFQKKRLLIQDKIADSLYIWMYFPLRYNKSKEKEIKKLGKNEQKIALYMKKKESAPISEILTKYQDSPIEETLTSVFNLVNLNILERMQFSAFSG